MLLGVAMASRHLTVTIEFCGRPAFGLWCDRHALPHRTAIVILVAGRPDIVHRCVD